MRAEVHRLAQHHGQVLGLLPREIRIKRMQTRWGSCGPRNDINLNWLLAFTPPSVLEYVVVHELCHIRHRNHSRDYWDLVSRHLPNWSQERRWLKAQGGELLRRFA
jgi:predicted metal-dependent hydrolase